MQGKAELCINSLKESSPLRVGPKWLCASAHVGCTRAVFTKASFYYFESLEKLNCIIELVHSESQNRKAFYTMSHTSSRERERETKKYYLMLDYCRVGSL